MAIRPVLTPGAPSIASGNSHNRVDQVGGELGYRLDFRGLDLRPALFASHT